MQSEWGIWDLTAGTWMHDPLYAPVNMSPARYVSPAEAERAANRDWRPLNPDRTFVVRPFVEGGSTGNREDFARGYGQGERDARSGRVKQLCVTDDGEQPPVVKENGPAYYHGYKAAVEGGARSEESAWAGYIAKHGMRTNPAHLSLDGKLSSRLGRQDGSHVGFDGDFSFGVGSKDDRHMRPNAGETLIDEGESIRSSMPGRTTLSLTTLSLGVPRRRRRVYAVRMGVDDRGIATGGFHWIPASEPEKAERFWLEHTGRRVSLRGGMHQNAKGDVIWQDTLLTWKAARGGIDMIPSKHGRARALEMLEAREGGHGQGPMNDQADFLEVAMGNGWSYVPPEDIGAMTDATIVSQDGFLGEDGKWYPHPEVESPVVYAHMNYATEDPIERWAEGKPVFWVSDPLEVSPEDRARIRQEYARVTGESYEANARGAYHGTGADPGDYVIRVHRGRFYVDRVDRGGTHTTIGSARGMDRVRDALKEAARDSHVQGNLTGIMFAQFDDGLQQIGNIDEGRFVPGGTDTVESVEEFVRERMLRNASAHEPNARKNVSAVIDAFMAGRRHSEKTCSTDGDRIYSYSLPIAARLANDQVVVLDKARSPSATTSSQINAVLAAIPSARTVNAIPGEHEPNMRGGGKVIESKRWRHRSGRTASPYGAVPWTGARGDRESDWELETVGWTIQWDDGTIGTGQVPAKTREEAEERLARIMGRRGSGHAANWRMMLDLPGVEQRLGSDHIAKVLAHDHPAAHAQSRATGYWDANDPEMFEAYTSLARMIEDGELDDLIAEARGKR